MVCSQISGYSIMRLLSLASCSGLIPAISVLAIRYIEEIDKILIKCYYNLIAVLLYNYADLSLKSHPYYYICIYAHWGK